jgi:hypothetical protein
MSPDPESGRRPEADKLPPRAETGTRYSYRSRRSQPNAPVLRLEQRLGARSFSKQDLRELCRQPWIFLVAALACIAVTFLVMTYVHGRDERRSVDVAHGNDGQAEKAAQAKS